MRLKAWLFARRCGSEIKLYFSDSKYYPFGGKPKTDCGKCTDKFKQKGCNTCGAYTFTVVSSALHCRDLFRLYSAATVSTRSQLQSLSCLPHCRAGVRLREEGPTEPAAQPPAARAAGVQHRRPAQAQQGAQRLEVIRVAS